MTPLRVRYQTIEFGHTDIHLRTLRDNQQYADVDGIALRLGISSAPGRCSASSGHPALCWPI